MSNTPVTPQIEGLPPGAILKAVQQPAIEGLPPGAILKPVGTKQKVEPVTPGVKSAWSSRAPVSSLLLGAAGGAGIPETKTPVRDLAAGMLAPDNVYAQAVASGQAHDPEQDPAYNWQPTPEEAAIIKKNNEDRKNAGFFARLTGSAPSLPPELQAKIDAHLKAHVMNAYKNYAPGIPIVSSATAAGANQADKSAQAFKEGRPYEGTVRAVGAAVPVVGPAAVEAGAEIGEGIENKDIDQILHGAGSGVGTVASMLLGTKKGQAAAEKVVSKTVRPVVNAVTGAPVAATSKVLGGGPKAMEKAPIKQQTAAGAATNAQVAQYAQSKGIDLLPGQATGAKGLQTLQAVGERSIVAPGELPEVLEKQKAAFGNVVDDFKTRVGTEAIPDTEHAGMSLQSQAHNGLNTLRKSAQADYGAFQEATGDIPVDLGEVKTKYAQKLADQAEALKNVPGEYASPVRNVLNKLSGIEGGPEANPKALKEFNDAVEAYGLNPEQQAALREKMGLLAEGGTAGVKMSTAQQLRSAYLDIARDYPGNVPKAVQRLAGEAARDIDAAMAKAADSVGATDQWRQANAKWKQLQDTYNNPDHPLYKVIQEADPSKVPSRLLGKGNYGGSPQTIRQLKQAGIDLSPLKREVAQQIADRNFALTNGGRGLAGFSTEFLRELYSPAELTELQMIGRVGRAIRFEMNPSGTSNVMEGRHQLEGIIHRTAGAVVGPIASRLTTSKALARSAIGDLSQVKPALSEAQPRGLLDILSKPPEEPPPPGPGSGPGPTPQGQPPSPASTNAVPAKIADYNTWRNANFKKSAQGGWEDASGKLYTDERLHQLHDDAVAGFQRGIKPPQKRTFERQTEADVKQFFNYRFDQLRNELKAAQAAGDQAAIADVQRRMKELDEIQRQPRALQDVLAGKPPKTAAEYAAMEKKPPRPSSSASAKRSKKGGK